MTQPNSDQPTILVLVALKSELPQDWLKKCDFPVHTLKGLSALKGSAKNLIKDGLFILVTGVGKENALIAADWVKDHFRSGYVLNLGTAGSIQGDLLVLDWVRPLTVINHKNQPIAVDGPIPLPTSQLSLIKSVKTLISVETLDLSLNQTNGSIVDMEAYWLAEQFEGSAFNFTVLKIVSDLNDKKIQDSFKDLLSKIRNKMKQLFLFLDPSKRPTISVVIPVYNRPQLVERALKSVLTQTLPPTDVIVVDDGSIDATSQILQQYKGKVNLITLPKNRGVSFARNIGVNEAKGDWVSFLDSDDEWDPNKLEGQSAYFKNHPFYEILQSEEIWIRNHKRVNQHKHHLKKSGWIFNICLERCMISPSSVLLKKSLLNKFGGFNEDLPACEDYDLWAQISRHHLVGLDPSKTLIKYGGHADQLSVKYEAMDRFRVQTLQVLFENETNAEIQIDIRKVLIKKLEVLSLGFQKRNGNLVQNPYADIIEERFFERETSA